MKFKLENFQSVKQSKHHGVKVLITIRKESPKFTSLTIIFLLTSSSIIFTSPRRFCLVSMKLFTQRIVGIPEFLLIHGFLSSRDGIGEEIHIYSSNHK